MSILIIIVRASVWISLYALNKHHCRLLVSKLVCAKLATRSNYLYW